MTHDQALKLCGSSVAPGVVPTHSMQAGPSSQLSARADRLLCDLEPSPDGKLVAVMYKHGFICGDELERVLSRLAVYDLEAGVQQAHLVRDSLLPCCLRWAGKRLSIAWHAPAGDSFWDIPAVVWKHLCCPAASAGLAGASAWPGITWQYLAWLYLGRGAHCLSVHMCRRVCVCLCVGRRGVGVGMSVSAAFSDQNQPA